MLDILHHLPATLPQLLQLLRDGALPNHMEIVAGCLMAVVERGDVGDFGGVGGI